MPQPSYQTHEKETMCGMLACDKKLDSNGLGSGFQIHFSVKQDAGRMDEKYISTYLQK